MAHDKIQAMHVKISSYVLADNSLDSQEFLQHPSFKTFSGVDILSERFSNFFQQFLLDNLSSDYVM